MQKTEARNKTSWLTGATLFLALVVYFNLRSGAPMDALDWSVIGAGALFLGFTLVTPFKNNS